MENLGYDTHSSVLILGSLWLFVIFYLVEVFVFLALSLLKKYGTGRFAFKLKFLKKWKKKLVFHDIILLAIDGFIEWTIAGYLNLSNPVTTHGGDLLSNFSAFVAIAICLFMVPALLIILMIQPKENMKTGWFYESFGIFFEDIKITSKFHMMFYVFWILRRGVFLYVCLFLQHNPSI
jgi:hypothetical protein